MAGREDVQRSVEGRPRGDQAPRRQGRLCQRLRLRPQVLRLRGRKEGERGREARLKALTLGVFAWRETDTDADTGTGTETERATERERERVLLCQQQHAEHERSPLISGLSPPPPLEHPPSTFVLT
eukprot:2729021-Rhodomonas_salina.1